MTYGPRLEKFLEPAQYRAEIWRLIIGIVLALVVYITVVIAITFAGLWATGWTIRPDMLMSPEAMAAPWPLLWLLSTFLGLLVAPFVAVRLLHSRASGTLFGRGAVFLRDFWTAGFAYLLVSLPVVALWIAFGDVHLNLSPLKWLAFLPMALVLLGVQTLSEEVFFRGYLLQQLGARFRHPIAWMIIPSFLFGSLHFNPALPTQDAWAIVGLTTLFGLVACDLTARTGSLGAAWGFHFVNNFLAMLLISVEGSLTGLSLFKTGFSALDGMPLPLLAGDAVLILLGWMLMRRMLQR